MKAVLLISFFCGEPRLWSCWGNYKAFNRWTQAISLPSGEQCLFTVTESQSLHAALNICLPMQPRPAHLARNAHSLPLNLFFLSSHSLRWTHCFLLHVSHMFPLSGDSHGKTQIYVLSLCFRSTRCHCDSLFSCVHVCFCLISDAEQSSLHWGSAFNLHTPLTQTHTHTLALFPTPVHL